MERRQPTARVPQVTNPGEGPHHPSPQPHGRVVVQPFACPGISRQFESMHKNECNWITATDSDGVFPSLAFMGRKTTPDPPAEEPSSFVRLSDKCPADGHAKGKDLGSWCINRQRDLQGKSSTLLACNPSHESFYLLKDCLTANRKKTQQVYSEYCWFPDHRKCLAVMERRKAALP